MAVEYLALRLKAGERAKNSYSKFVIECIKDFDANTSASPFDYIRFPFHDNSFAQHNWLGGYWTKIHNDDSTKYIFNDGGRAAAGYSGTTGDCVTRAIAIATGKPYQEVYDALRQENKDFAHSSRSKAAKQIKTRARKYAPSEGVHRKVFEKYLLLLGWKWNPTMKIGQGCKVHLNPNELPKGRIIVSVSKHIVAMIDGVVHDTFDCTRDNQRCVYGYYTISEVQEISL